MTVQYEQQQIDYIDTPANKMPTPLPRTGYLMMEEEVDIFEEEETERIEVPRFDECRRSVVIHDFHMVSFLCVRELKFHGLMNAEDQW